MTRCVNGHDVGEGDKFCTLCGAQVPSTPAPTPEVLDSRTSPGLSQPPPPPSPTPPADQSPAATQNPWADARAWTDTTAYVPPAQVPPDSGLSFPDPGPATAHRRNRWFLLAGGIGLAVVVVVGLVVGLGAINRGVAVPDVVGLTYDQATEVLQDSEFTSVTRRQEYSDTVPQGLVIEQTPLAAESVSTDTQITLTVSQGPELTTVRVIFDMGTLRAYVTSSLDCDLALLVFESTYPRPALVDESGERVGSLRSTGWVDSSSNGTYYPCTIETRFENVPVNRESYQVELDPSDPTPERSPERSRSTLERNGWVIEW